MAISDKLNSIKAHIAAAYTAIEGKGGLIPQNKNCFNLAGAIEQMPTGGATLNIAYSETAPTDTSKLWIKAEQPTDVTVSCNPEQQVEGFVNIDAVLPLALYTPTCSRVGDNIFIFGGRYNTSSGSVSSKNIYKFNISTKTISQLSVTLPAGIVGAISATIGTKIYIFETTTHKYVFDAETETISTLSVTPPTDFSNARCVSKDSGIFIFASSGDIYRYDANLNTITRIGKLPTYLYYPAVARVGAKIYVMGGSTGASDNYVDTIYEFDTDTFQTNLLSTTLPTPTRWGMAESIGSCIYFFGGRITTPSAVSSQEIYKFNTATKIIETLSVSLPVALYGSAHEMYGQQIFIFGGSDSSNAIYNFVSSFVLTQNNILILQDQTQNIFDLLSAPTKVQIGIKNVYKGNAGNEAEFVDAYLFNNEKYAWVNVNTGVALYKTLEESTWNEIATASANGTASAKWAIGDEKTMTLTTGEEVTVQILGFNHDDLADTSGKAGITFGMKNLLAATYQMNRNDNNGSGWYRSVMKNSTMATLLSQLPTDLSAVIKTVNKSTMEGGQVTDTEVSTNSLFLFSLVELNNTTDTGYKDEGTQYEYWKTRSNGADWIKKLSNGSGDAYVWWLRTPYAGNTKSFCSISADGYSNRYGANTTNGVCFGFCI